MGKCMTALLLLAGVLMLPGCATKTYGRLEPVTAAEEDGMDCQTIDQQLVAARTFKDDVNQRSDTFGAADVLAFLLDFGVGNHLEREAALKSADERAASLTARRSQMHCPALVAGAEKP